MLHSQIPEFCHNTSPAKTNKPIKLKLLVNYILSKVFPNFSFKSYNPYSTNCSEGRDCPLMTVRNTIRYCIDNNGITDYLQHNESEVIDMFVLEWNEKEELDTLLEADELATIAKPL